MTRPEWLNPRVVLLVVAGLVAVLVFTPMAVSAFTSDDTSSAPQPPAQTTDPVAGDPSSLATSPFPSATATSPSPRPTSSPTRTSGKPSPTTTRTTARPVVTPTPATAAGITKVLVLIGENHSLNASQKSMPKVLALARQHAYATGYRATTHPSEPNYIAISAGSTLGDSKNHNPAFQTGGRSVFGAALAAGKTAKVYAEAMQSNCQQSNSGRYAVKHNPWPSFRDERAACNTSDVPLGTTSSGNLRNDIAAGRLPTVGMAVPDMCNSAHDCSLGTYDRWAADWLDKIFAGPDYTSGRLAVVVTFDEDGKDQDNTVLTAVFAKSLRGSHHVVTSRLTHFSLTGLLNDVAGAPRLRGAASAPGFAKAFGLRLTP